MRLELPLTISLSLPARKGEPASGRIGDYQLEELLGRGAYSEVYRAKHLFLGDEVALKLMNYMRAFEKELSSLRRLDHPHILRILYAGSHDDHYYLALELGDGDLTGVELPEREVLKLGYALASALQYAHSMRIVHGDVKPSNVILVRGSDGYVPKLADFSIAKIMAEEATATMTTFKGTPGFVDEHLLKLIGKGEQPTFEDYVRADIYSLGKLLHYVIRKPSKELASLVREMTSPFPEERPSLKEIMERLATMMERYR